MKSIPDRIWMVVLGIAVAVIVAVTTIYWSKPLTSRDSSTNPGTSGSPKALIPKIGGELLPFFTHPKAPASLRTK
jgi:hypothetical protein